MVQVRICPIIFAAFSALSFLRFGVPPSSNLVSPWLPVKFYAVKTVEIARNQSEERMVKLNPARGSLALIAAIVRGWSLVVVPHAAEPRSPVDLDRSEWAVIALENVLSEPDFDAWELLPLDLNMDGEEE